MMKARRRLWIGRALATGLVATSIGFLAAAPAWADKDHNGWSVHGYYGGYYYTPPPAYYYRPPPVYYYSPPPAYYYSPPPAYYYGPPSVGFSFRF